MSDLQRLAWNAVHRAVANGTLVKPSACSSCKTEETPENIDAHHHNGYEGDAALQVTWLCKSCHGLEHGGAWLITDDQRRQAVQTRMERYTPEERSAMSLSRGTAEERSAWVRKGVIKANANRTPEERSALARKAAMTGTPEERRARAMKAVEARRANRAQQ